MSDFNRDLAIETLIADDMDSFDCGATGYVASILENGFKGYANMTDDELIVELEERELNVVDRDYDDSMDGDLESGLASAGWGTDEDYNGYDYGDEY